MMNYSQHNAYISTVQLSPFSEDQWNRMVTCSPTYIQWPDIAVTDQNRPKKRILGQRNLIGPINMKTVKLEDEILLRELHALERSAAMPSLSRHKEKYSHHDFKFFSEAHDRRTTSPTDEYERSSDFFYQTRESPKLCCSYGETSFPYPQHMTKSSFLQSQIDSNGPMKTLSEIDLGPKPEVSVSIQLRQSAMTREHALGVATDHRSTTPISMSSGKRAAGGSVYSSRRGHPLYQFSYCQTPTPTETNAAAAFYEQLATESSASIKKSCTRSTNRSRSTVHMIRTKSDRARQKQHIGLRTVLIEPCKQPILRDKELEEKIPNSIEIMRKLPGSINAFERNLRHTYHRHLNHYRNDLRKP